LHDLTFLYCSLGRTPFVKINNIPAKTCANLFGEIETYNPVGSVKDRIWLAMIENAEEKGLLKPGDTLVELTSGNKGIALAMVATVRVYKTVFTIPVQRGQIFSWQGLSFFTVEKD